ncbi:MAG: hypothetical protein KDC71_21645 [Acidobacteria bacterium]|nr:hypothetical protein [Acidobacteriota bacterium]
MNELSPRSVLLQAHQEWPGIWRIIEAIRMRKNSQWPPSTYLPLEFAGEAIVQWMREHDPISLKGLHPSNLVEHASTLSGLAAWRMGQGIYRFDPALYGALIETPVTGELPGQLLRHLPEWCVYLETPDLEAPLMFGGTAPIRGVWAWLDHTADGIDVLTLMLHTEGWGRLPIGHVPLVGTLDEGLAKVESDWREAVNRGNAEGYPSKDYKAAARQTFGPLLSLILYLCSEAPDLNGTPQKPKPKKTREGNRVFAADHPTVWQVGERIGAALRQAFLEHETHQHTADSETGRTRPRAHLRRAHWHTYLTGKGRTTPVLKWMPPLPINMGSLDAQPATIHPVKSWK